MSKVLTPEQFIISIKAVVGAFLVDEYTEESYSDKNFIIISKWADSMDLEAMEKVVNNMSKQEYVDEVIDYLDNLKPENLQ